MTRKLADAAVNLMVLDIHDEIADLFASDDPAAAEAIRQVARQYIEERTSTMDEVFDEMRAAASNPAVRAALHRAQDYCRRIAELLETTTKVDG